VPEAVLYHRAWRTAHDYVPLRWNYGVGRGAYYAKYFGANDGHMWRRLLRDVWRHVLSGVYYLRSDRRRALGDMALTCGILYGAVGWIFVANGSNPRARAAASGRDSQPAQKGSQARRG